MFKQACIALACIIFHQKKPHDDEKITGNRLGLGAHLCAYHCHGDGSTRRRTHRQPRLLARHGRLPCGCLGGLHCSRGSPYMVSPAMVQADNGPWGQQANPAHGRCHGNVCRHRPVGTGPAWHRRARHPRRTVALWGRTGGERGRCLPCRKAYGHAHQGIWQ